MGSTKHEKRRRARRLGLAGFLVCAVPVFLPMGCTGSIETAPLRYRDQHQNSGHLLPDFTVERLQACTEEYGGEITDESLRVGAFVEVDHDGRIQDVTVAGIPDSASDLAACTRIALREMSVPQLPLRSGTKDETANIPAKPGGNEMAHPGVLVEVAIVLGEFVAQHGGKVVLYAVTIQVLSALAIEGYKKLSAKCRRVKAACIISCGDSAVPTWDPAGDPFHKCMRNCMERAGCFYNLP